MSLTLKLLPFALLCAAVPAGAAQGPVPANVSACFTPGPESCAELIADAIDAARSSVRVQAYWLTSTTILRALAVAKRRGVDVEAVLDKSQDRRDDPRGRYSSAVYLVHAGVPVWIDDQLAIAHNKVVVIDGHLVITGSFNFTRSADSRNAETTGTRPRDGTKLAALAPDPGSAHRGRRKRCPRLSPLCGMFVMPTPFPCGACKQS